MSNLSILTLENSKWDEIVTSFKDHDIYYLRGYLKSLEVNKDGQALLFYFENESTRGINVVLKRDLHDDLKLKDYVECNQYFDLTSPYGYGGWIIEGENDDELFDEYEKWCIQNNIVSEFVRFHPLIENHKNALDKYQVVALGKVISMDCSDEEKLWSNMSSRNRNKIKKAIKTGVVVKKCGAERLDDFIKIYEETMKRDHASEYYFFGREYYNCLFNDLKENIAIFYSELDNQMLSNCIVFLQNNRMSYHLAGSTRTSGNIYETNLLIYEVAKWGNLNGYKSFLLGGGVGSNEDQLFQFKKGFDDKNSYQFYIGKKIFNKEKYDQLANIRTDIANQSFFPLYRG